VVGDDFTAVHRQPLLDRKVDISGLTTAKGRTFRWSGVYGDDLNSARTLDTQLNVFADFKPEVPQAWRDTPLLFLANIDPELQWNVLEQVRGAKLVAADTMNYWIDSKPEALKKLLGRVDVLLINDGEIRQLTGGAQPGPRRSRRLAPGAKVVVVNRGEHGVLVVPGDCAFALPPSPSKVVTDPNGCGGRVRRRVPRISGLPRVGRGGDFSPGGGRRAR
jgi:sugar/nucleoside kinase (ribokinase family)